MQKNAVALLGAGLLQQPFLQEAKDRGLYTIALDQNPEAIAAKDADIFLTVQISDGEKVLSALVPYRERLKFVATVATDFTHIVGYINDALKLTGPNFAQGKILTHKGEMRNFCKTNGFLCPPFIVTQKKEDAETWAKENPSEKGYVIKPAQNMGARGVMYLKRADELAFAFEFASTKDKKNEIILEHFIEAREISVDALSFEGKVFLTGVADRIIEIKDRHFFIETGHTLPGNFSSKEYTLIQNTMQRYADALSSLSNKPYHGALKGDLRLTPQGELFIGEIAGRLSGGFMSTHTYPAAHKKNLMQMFIRLMQHDASVILPYAESIQTKAFAIERSMYATAGELCNLKSAEEIQQLENEFRPQGLIRIFKNYQNGDTVSNLQNNVGKVYHTVIQSDTLSSAENLYESVKERLKFTTKIPEYNWRKMSKASRTKWNNAFCWVCKVCDGVYCASSVPGMGGPGLMDSFQDNINALQEYKIAPSYIHQIPPEKEIDISFQLFHSKALTFSAPILSAPITGSVTNMGGSITEYDYAMETGSAMVALNLIPTFGDGASPDKYKIGLHAIEGLGKGIPVFKPRSNQKELILRIKDAEKSGATAWAMDIDGVSFKTMVLKSAETRHKSLEELKELRLASSLPFIIKGVMNIRDAEIAALAGASAIVVSNHGGRVLDALPGTARVLPQIAAWVKLNAPKMQVLADGGVRSGADVFRMLALGAEAVLVGRPIAIIAVGYGRCGVQSLIRSYNEELKQTMRVLGISSLKGIRPEHITKFI
ncbi:MAG: L-lactate dehydrogenase [Turneriella sp.]|nr:L-lactate dehydrogenase [Turneriella sp.]